MRHHNTNRKFGRKKDERQALIRSLAISLIEHGRIRTTEAKAKELRPFVEKLITTGRANTLTARRLVVSRLGGSEQSAKKLINDIAPRFADRPGGYTRIIRMPARPGDASRMAVIEFIA
jgi:large subunit ribosomal protein L17